MRDTFKILAGFLDKFGHEVEGRELQEPSDETKAMIHQLARGQLGDEQRAELFGQLNRHPQWVAWLAREVKAMRATQGME